MEHTVKLATSLAEGDSIYDVAENKIAIVVSCQVSVYGGVYASTYGLDDGVVDVMYFSPGDYCVLV